ncbi:hypothetical protein WH47_09170 [Habropoda laboriosa]|uniref:Uncharacterized protein n=1 Tax=Habropoda laboriosa TaxID=597456 RepID=A0A0L7QN25_9HYME|nr:hypothetical protein WH47_09170 [Habropoda laboriosa]
MIRVKPWYHLGTSFLDSPSRYSFSSFDRNVKARTTQSRALRYVFLLLAIKYTLFSGLLWRYCEHKEQKDKSVKD